MIEVRNLSARAGRKHVIQRLSFRAEPGSVTLVTGPNGSGKSTLLDCLTGFRHFDGGSFTIGAGRERVRLNTTHKLEPLASRRARLSRLGVRRSFQWLRLFPRLSLEQHLELCGVAESNMTIALHEIFKSRQATGTKDENWPWPSGVTPTELSFGEGKLFQTSLTLAGARTIAILDEPFAGLDAARAEVLRQVIGEIANKREIAILIVEHWSNRRWLAGLVTHEVSLGAPFDEAGDAADPTPLIMRKLSAIAQQPPTMIPVAEDAAIWSLPTRGGERPRVRLTASAPPHAPNLPDALNIRVDAGDDLACVTAPNGFGKTTFLRDLARRASEHDRGLVSYVPLSTSTLSEARVSSILHWAGLEADDRLAKLASQRFATLSGGERKRVELAVSLALKASITALDEPTTALDQEGLESAANLIYKHRDGAFVLMMEPSRHVLGETRS